MQGVSILINTPPSREGGNQPIGKNMKKGKKKANMKEQGHKRIKGKGSVKYNICSNTVGSKNRQNGYLASKY